MSEQEIADALQVHVATVRMWVDQGCPTHDLEAASAWVKQRLAEAEAPLDPVADLAKRVRECGSAQEYAELSKELLAATISGRFPSAKATAIRQMLGQVGDALASLPTHEVDKQLLCTEEAAEVVRLFEQLINGRRRQAVLAHLRVQLAEEEVEFPDALDREGVLRKLAELGLDGFGEPLA